MRLLIDSFSWIANWDSALEVEIWFVVSTITDVELFVVSTATNVSTLSVFEDVSVSTKTDFSNSVTLFSMPIKNFKIKNFFLK